VSIREVLNSKPVTYAVVALVLGGAVYLLARRGLKGALQAVNPTSDKNLAYTGVNKIGEAVTGDRNWSFGSWLYDINPFNKPYDPNAPATPIVRNSAANRSPTQPVDKPTVYVH
jgi:hypothetical protein